MRPQKLFALAFLALAVLYGFGLLTQRPVSAEDDNQNSKMTVTAAGRGNPYLNYRDGYEIGSKGGEAAIHGDAMSVASADFDSDGTKDVVVLTGNAVAARLIIYRGNSDAIYGNSPSARRHKIESGSDPEPLGSGRLTGGDSLVADTIKSGDFDADGRQDILAYTKVSNRLTLMKGDGKGNFSIGRQIALEGRIAALETGSIGRADGLEDVAVSIETSEGSSLLIFEHPEGAFARPPEKVDTPRGATAVAIGNLDDDGVGDVAIAAGNELVFVHGSQQIYPFDMIEEAGLQRPAKQIGTRRFPFRINGIATGKFSVKNRPSVMLVDDAGGLHLLEAPAKQAKLRERIPERAKRTANTPSNGSFTSYEKVRNDITPTHDEAERRGYFVTEERDDQKRLEEYNRWIENKIAASAARTKGRKPESKKPYLDEGFFTNPSRIVEWTEQAIRSDVRLSADSRGESRWVTAKVSNSDLDDLIFVDRNSKQIHIVNVQNVEAGIISLDVDGSPNAILPIRLNKDALSDLVVLREGSAQPSVVMTSPAATYVVNTTDDSTSQCDASVCTLRGAIQSANLNAGADEIVFDIPNPNGDAQTIVLQSELPIVGGPTTLDATTQPGFNGSPIVEIDGSNLVSATDGIKLRTSDSVVRGFVINDLPHADLGDTGSFVGGNAITIETLVGQTRHNNNFIENNFLGTDVTGTSDEGNASTGVLIFDGDSNTIGGTLDEARNVISGNGDQDEIGAGISVVNGMQNQFKGNYIGINADGDEKLGNSYGFDLTGFLNTVGGDEAGAENTISGNGEIISTPFGDRCRGIGLGIVILLNSDNQNLTQFSVIKGNRFGTDPSGTTPLGNCSWGISTVPLTQTQVGSNTETGRNVISDNGFNAVNCSNRLGIPILGGFCIVSGNNIGTDITGTVAMANDRRNQADILIFAFSVVTADAEPGGFASVGAPGQATAGGPCTGFCNLISGNNNPDTFQDAAIGMSGFGSMGTFNSYIGTNLAGTAALPNYSAGSLTGNAFLGNVGFVGGAPDDFTPLGNLISGNSCAGMQIFAYDGEGAIATFASAKNNLIGTNVTGSNAIPNTTDPGCSSNPLNSGLTAFASPLSSAQVGGTEKPGERNVISGNGASGFVAAGNSIAIGNYIGVRADGVTPLGNAGHGVFIRSLGVNLPNTLGGTGTGEQNIVRSNGGAGVFVQQTFPQFGVIYTTTDFRANSISNNGGLGIELFPAGPNGIDAGDADIGSNELQNFPSLDPPVFNGNGTLTVPGRLLSTPNQNFRLDFYSNTTGDASLYGEGETYIGTINVATNASGIGSFTFNSSGSVPAGSAISATATNSGGNTSEFSCIAGQCVADASITKTDDVDPIVAGETLTYTLVVTNHGPAAAPSVVVSDELPASAIFVSAVSTQGTCSNSSGTVTCNIGAMNLNAQVTVTIKGTPTTAGNITNNATVAHGLSDPVSANNTDDEMTQVVQSEIIVTTTGDEQDADAGDSVCDVDLGTPENQCTLRAAIQVSNSRASIDAITFNIPGGGNKTITPQSVLPTVTQTATIDAATQPGFNDLPVVELNGGGGGFDALTVTAGNCIISGFAINRFGGNGIIIQGGPGGNMIEGNIIGTDVNGTAGIGLGGDGIVINNSPNNQIGTAGTGFAPLRFTRVAPDGRRIEPFGGLIKNLIGSSRNGLKILGPLSIFNAVRGLVSGVFPTGSVMTPLANQLAGIAVQGAMQTLIGGMLPQDKCTISGNQGPGVRIEGGSLFTKLLGSFIGTTANGDTGLGNLGAGVEIEGASQTEIGGLIAGAANFISGNGAFGLMIKANANNATAGNRSLGNLFGARPNSLGGILSGLGNFRDNVLVDGAEDTTLDSNTIVDSKTGCGTKLLDSQFALAKYRDPKRAKRPELGGIFKAFRNSVGLFKGLGGIAQAAGNLLGGLCIENFQLATIGAANLGNIFAANGGPGIKLFGPGTTGFRLAGNTIGTDENGTPGLGNQEGILIEGARDGDIGGNVAGEGNTMAGNAKEGLKISSQDAQNVVRNLQILFNKFGVKPNDSSPLGNLLSNISLNGGFGNLLRGNTIAASQNGCGVLIRDSLQLFQQILGMTSRLLSNKIGLNGNSAAPNALGGVCVDNTPNVEIGDAGAGNEIAGNSTAPGISILGALAKFFKIHGNFIGTNSNGLGGIGNMIGILIEGARDGQIGGPLAGLGNVISGNSLQGLLARPLIGPQTSAVINLNVSNNKFGMSPVNPFGPFLPNTGDNILLNGSFLTTVSLNTIIASQTGYGVRIQDAQGLFQQITDIIAKMTKNMIGAINGSGAPIEGVQYTPAPNALGGILVDNVPRVTIGGPGEGNIIGSNNGNGITVSGADASVNNVFANFIGTDETGTVAIGNTENGVLLTNGATLNTIGGPGSGVGNTIAFNGESGIALDPTAGIGNNLDPNSIYGNTLLGIDLGGDGLPTANDPQDADTGPNNLQNYPVITGIQNVGGDLIVTYMLDSHPSNTSYGTNGVLIEFFKTDNLGQGKTFIGSDLYTTADHSGTAAVKSVNLGNAAALGIVMARQVIATATDALGNTSEFSPLLAPTNARVTVGGTVRTASAAAISNATLTLASMDGPMVTATSDTSGRFTFWNVPVGTSYVISVSHPDFVFADPTRVIMLNDAVADIVFTASTP